jgi:hypothetical protein
MQYKASKKRERAARQAYIAAIREKEASKLRRDAALANKAAVVRAAQERQAVYQRRGAFIARMAQEAALRLDVIKDLQEYTAAVRGDALSLDTVAPLPQWITAALRVQSALNATIAELTAHFTAAGPSKQLTLRDVQRAQEAVFALNEAVMCYSLGSRLLPARTQAAQAACDQLTALDASMSASAQALLATSPILSAVVGTHELPSLTCPKPTTGTCATSLILELAKGGIGATGLKWHLPKGSLCT